jgi:uncharacterized membrane protein YkvI
MEQLQTKKTDTGLIYGLIAGAASIVFTLILYLGGIEWFTSPLAYLAFAIPVVVAVLGGLKERKLLGGYITFKEALKTVFIIFIIFIILDTLFSQLLLNVIDVPFREALMQDAGVRMEKFLTKMGAGQDAIDKALADMQDPSNFGFKKVLLGVLFRCIGWFIVALIIAAIIKKKRPEFENQI